MDHYEQPYNKRASGPIKKIQLPLEKITQLHGILIDIDPDLFIMGMLPKVARQDPRKFFQLVARPWLQRDPVLQTAEVRNSGRGLHVLIWFKEPLVFRDEADRQRWAGIVEVIQAVLPTDPDAPGITAVTRPCGSTNSKTGSVVETLQKGEPVEVEQVVELFNRICSSPFGTIMRILLGDKEVRPCPVCMAEGTRLSAGDHVGFCYGSCGQVKLDRLYELFLAPRPRKEAQENGGRK